MLMKQKYCYLEQQGEFKAIMQEQVTANVPSREVTLVFWASTWLLCIWTWNCAKTNIHERNAKRHEAKQTFKVIAPWDHSYILYCMCAYQRFLTLRFCCWPMIRKRLLVHEPATTETQTGSEPPLLHVPLYSVFYFTLLFWPQSCSLPAVFINY